MIYFFVSVRVESKAWALVFVKAFKPFKRVFFDSENYFSAFCKNLNFCYKMLITCSFEVHILVSKVLFENLKKKLRIKKSVVKVFEVHVVHKRFEAQDVHKRVVTCIVKDFFKH